MGNTGKQSWPILAVASMFLLAVACRPRDPEIAESVRSKVSSLAQGISVEVREGIVTLTGEVADSALRASIEGMSKGIVGVRSVVNAIRVSPPPPVPATREAVRERILAALEARGIRDLTVEVDTAMVATLSGFVEIPKDSLAMAAARDAGASRVINRMKMTK